MESLRLEPATAADIPVILDLIREMAVYERLEHRLHVTDTLLREHVFGERPCAEVLLGFDDGVAVAYAMFLPKYSSFLGRPLLFLEDIYIRTQARGKGFGRAIMAHLARLTIERGWAYMTWKVLDWNEPAIEFYRKLGALRLEGESDYSLQEEALARLASEG